MLHAVVVTAESADWVDLGDKELPERRISQLGPKREAGLAYQQSIDRIIGLGLNMARD